jgi:hypothetical protein
MRSFLLFLFIWVIQYASLNGQAPVDIAQSVMIEANVEADPAQVTLSWVADPNATSYRIYRRVNLGQGWGASIATLAADDLNWTDTDIQVGVRYEYRVEKILASGSGNGYILTGITVGPQFHNGLAILVIDDLFEMSLAPEIDRLHYDIEDDGWKVVRLYVNREDSVGEVRTAIKEIYDSISAPLTCAFLVGKVPIPYSGNIAPDGHVPDHQGAWPCDGYYSELNGNWTDNSVNFAQATDPRNRNIPGDGKFDQSSFPSGLEIAVGRIDFHNMPAFPQSEEELLRRYLNKNHAWRRGQITVEERGVVQNNFGGLAEGFGQNGWKNFTPMFGKDNVFGLSYRTELQTSSYLWSYGAGPGGPTSVGGITNTTNYVTDSLQTVFTMLFGSYFGDWGYTNNVLRASLASGATLSNAWAGRPNWQFHHMALGESLAFSALISMNNAGNYQTGFGARSVHMALLGDPTLEMHILAHPEQLTVVQNQLHANLSWDAVSEAEGYHIYRRAEGEADFVLLNEEAWPETTYTDSCAGSGLITYQVRAVALRESASGSYYNLGSAARADVDMDISAFQAQSQFELDIYYDRLDLVNLSNYLGSSVWHFGNGDSLEAEVPLNYLYAEEGEYTLCLTTSDGCFTDTYCEDIMVANSLPMVVPEIDAVRCYGEATGKINLLFVGGTPQLDMMWIGPYMGNPLENIPAGEYLISITSETGKQGTFGPFTVSQPDSLAYSEVINHPSTGQNNGSIMVDVTGGIMPYTYLWCDGSSLSMANGLAAGNCCVTVTDANNCKLEACFDLMETSAVTNIKGIEKWHLYPNPATSNIQVDLIFGQSQKGSFTITSIDGSQLSRYDREGRDWSGILTLDHIPAGSYLLMINTGEGTHALPFVKGQ